MINNATENDEAKRLWLSLVTVSPFENQGVVQTHYETLVLEDVDEKNAQIKEAKLDGQRSVPDTWVVHAKTDYLPCKVCEVP